jgi:hypothetical protein
LLVLWRLAPRRRLHRTEPSPNAWTSSTWPARHSSAAPSSASPSAAPAATIISSTPSPSTTTTAWPASSPSTRTLSGRLDLGVFSNVNAVILPELPEELTARAAETRGHSGQHLTAAREKLERLRRAERKPLEQGQPPEAKPSIKTVLEAPAVVLRACSPSAPHRTPCRRRNPRRRAR